MPENLSHIATRRKTGSKGYLLNHVHFLFPAKLPVSLFIVHNLSQFSSPPLTFISREPPELNKEEIRHFLIGFPPLESHIPHTLTTTTTTIITTSSSSSPYPTVPQSLSSTTNKPPIILAKEVSPTALGAC